MATLDIIVKPKLKFSLKKCGEVVPYGITPEEREKLAGIEENANNYEHPETHPSSILDVVDVVNGAANKFLNERGEMVAVKHESLTDKNSEAAVQHIDTTTTKTTLDDADMVAVKDSETGKMVLTPKSNLESLIAEYTYNENKEVVVSSVDIAISTFTAVNHGLTNGMVIFPTLNWSAGATFPLAVFVGGLNMGLYFVVNKTDNTFQLSLTSGGAAITLSENATMDLSKWHFEERKFLNQKIVISGLNISECRVILQGKSVVNGTFYLPHPNGVFTGYTDGNGYGFQRALTAGNIMFFLETTIRIQPFISIDTIGNNIIGSTSIANINARVNEGKYSMNNSQTSINSISTQLVGNQCFANGTTIKIYKL